MYMNVLSTCVSIYHRHAWCLWKTKEGIRSPGAGVTEGCEPPCGCWEQNLGLLESKCSQRLSRHTTLQHTVLQTQTPTQKKGGSG